MRTRFKLFLAAASLLALFAFGLSSIAEVHGPAVAVGVLLSVMLIPASLRVGHVLGLRSETTLLPAFNAVAASSTATTRLPRNRRYHALYLQYKTNANQATIQADISQIRIKVNSKVVRQFSATQLYTINALNGIAFSAGMIPIYFSEPRRRTPEGEEYLALNAYELLGVGDVDIEVDIAAGAVAPTLSGVMEFDYQRPADVWADIPGAVPGATDAQKALAPSLRTFMHWLPKVTPCNAAFTAAAPLTPANFFPAVAGWIHRVHSFDAVITQNILRDGDTPFWNLTTVQATAVLLSHALTIQANTFSLVLDSTQQYVDGLFIPSVANLGLDFVTSGAATGNQFNSIIELRKPLDA